MDQQDDISGREAYRLLSSYPQPATIIKSASVAEKQAFADVGRRKFPCDTAFDTWLSTLFFLDKQAAYTADEASLVDVNLQKAAEYFGIRPQTNELRCKFASDLAVTSPVEYVFSWKDENGLLQSRWPMRDFEEVKQAAAGLLKYRDRLDYAERRQAAARILKTAKEYGEPLPDVAFLRKIAGQGVCDKRTAVETIQARASLVKLSQPDVSVELEKLASCVLATPATACTPDNLGRLAAILDQADVNYGLRGEAGYPEDALFQITLDDLEHVKRSYTQFPNGAVYSKVELEQIPAATIAKWFGGNFAKEATIAGLFTVDADTLAEKVGALSPEQQQLFDKMAAAAGLEPALAPEDLATPLPMSKQAMHALLTS